MCKVYTSGSVCVCVCVAVGLVHYGTVCVSMHNRCIPRTDMDKCTVHIYEMAAS